MPALLFCLLLWLDEIVLQVLDRLSFALLFSPIGVRFIFVQAQ